MIKSEIVNVKNVFKVVKHVLEKNKHNVQVVINKKDEN